MPEILTPQEYEEIVELRKKVNKVILQHSQIIDLSGKMSNLGHGLYELHATLTGIIDEHEAKMEK